MSKSPSIAISPSVAEYFGSVVDDALRLRNVQASAAASQYVVGVLCDFARPQGEAESAFSKPLTFQLRDALEAPFAERFRRLRTLGDNVLYAVGFFGGHIELRGIDRKYVMQVGSSAYSNAAAMLHAPGGLGKFDVLEELAVKFTEFVDVVAEVAEGAIAHGTRNEQGIVRLYERWLRTGSSRIAEELGARGIIPTRAVEGLN
ncbi:MAG TPA: hypothetical protein PK156_27390 [Polyangium sp.]|nr:hypothetical protein [Polyangium sp.]